MSLTYGKTRVVICADYHDLGAQAAQTVAAALRDCAVAQDTVRAVFAAGESQATFLDALVEEPAIPWDRIECLNMDELWEPGLPWEVTCGHQVTRQLYDRVHPRAVHLPRHDAPDPQAEADRFEALLRERPVDVLCQGIGTSGHLALNEPGITRFDDPRWVRVVEVAAQSKRQLSADPNFAALGHIPDLGLTMTLTALGACRRIFTIVPLALKRDILTRLAALDAPSEDLPASLLREWEGLLFVDRDSCPEAWAATP